ncbi:hypothetical protein ISCGN_030425 [Ixodes scapularis]
MTSAMLPLGTQRCPRDWRTRLRSALLGSRPTARRGPAVTAVFRVTTTVVVSPFVIIASRSFVHTMDTTCAESQTYAAVVQTSSNAVDTKTGEECGADDTRACRTPATPIPPVVRPKIT